MIKRLLQLLLSSFCAVSFAAMGQAFPSKPIRIVVPFGPGSATDTITRLLVDKAGKSLGTTFIVDNKSGANGLIAAREVVGSPKDGYTIIISSNSAHAANQYLYKNLGYDPVKDFAPITGLTTNPHVFVVRASLPVQNLKELIQYGASPRATIALTIAAKAKAFLDGRGYVTPQDVKDIALDVLRHRIGLTYEAEALEKSSEDVVRSLLEHVPVP